MHDSIRGLFGLVMAIIASPLLDQNLLFTEQGLIAGQQRVEIRLVGPHRFFQQGEALLIQVDECVERARLGRWGKALHLLAEVGQAGNG